jgi:hypothetical protein
VLRSLMAFNQAKEWQQLGRQPQVFGGRILDQS